MFDRVKENLLLRLCLILTLIIYIPWDNFLLITVKGESSLLSSVPGEMENGMGGSINNESLFQGEFFFDFDPEFDPDFIGIPEPEDYSMPQVLTFSSYTLQSGDIIGHIAIMTGLNEDTLVSVNNINNTRLLQIGQNLRIPNQDGIYYQVRQGDTLVEIAEQYGTTVERITTVNELFSENINAGMNIFIPEGRMDWVRRQEINGDLFLWPSRGRITSPYGWRLDPFGSGIRQFHTGIDIGGTIGTPIVAAMSGRVAHVGYDGVYGNYLIINHHSGYRTLYAHLSTVRVRAGAYVATGQRIGDVGISGRVTGPHLHFTVYKDGVTVNPLTLMR